MKFLLRLFAAFCVATVLAQLIIVGMAAARGNLRQETLTKALALFNGIDVTGQQLQQAFKEAKSDPGTSYDEVLAKRAQEDLNLGMRDRAIKYAADQVELKRIALERQITDFDLRKDAFYKKLDAMEKEGKEANLGVAQKWVESMAPEQAKTLLLKMMECNQMDEVVAIVKGMANDKRKKIMDEFDQEQIKNEFHLILNQILQGQPARGLIDQARNAAGTDTATN
ncbi:MAG: hypothetical protein U0892_00460 [Pirellulales bacterium]